MQLVRVLLERGSRDREIAQLTGIPGNTVGRWRRGATQAFGVPPQVHVAPWRPADEPAYAQLLGLYLGDGCVSVTGRRVLFRIALDTRYPGIIGEAAEVIRRAVGSSVSVQPRRDAAMVWVQSSGRVWLDAIPQHGPGRKHERPIVLAPWQEAVVQRFPQEFLRGLIHSDGCRTENRFRTRLPSGRVAGYAYPRYFFSNPSADIRGLFCASCDQLGIRWTQSNARNISIAHRASVAALDAFVGPKA